MNNASFEQSKMFTYICMYVTAVSYEVMIAILCLYEYKQFIRIGFNSIQSMKEQLYIL